MSPRSRRRRGESPPRSSRPFCRSASPPHGKEKAIKEFAEAAFRSKKAPELRADASSVSKMVDDVYKEGRNKLVHGNLPSLMEYYSEPRMDGDRLVTSLFGAATATLAEILSNERRREATQKEQIAFRVFREHL